MKTSSAARLALFTLALVSMASGGACLPEDTTLEKGAFELHIRPATDSASWVTADRWQISLRRGSASLRLSPACTVGEGPTHVFFDALRGTSALSRAIRPGPCVVSFAYEAPSFAAGTAYDPLLESDRALLVRGGRAVHLAGEAARDGERISFDLTLAPGDGAPLTKTATVPGGDKSDLDVELDFRELFREGNAALRFDALAYADQQGNHDGKVDDGELDGLATASIPASLGTYAGADTLRRYVERRLSSTVR
jgi:hypothetical protein